jgi:hypothetical protein
MSKDSKDQYSEQETQRRMEAALRGARITGHKPMADLKSDRSKSKRSTASKRKPK